MTNDTFEERYQKMIDDEVPYENMPPYQYQPRFREEALTAQRAAIAKVEELREAGHICIQYRKNNEWVKSSSVVDVLGTYTPRDAHYAPSPDLFTAIYNAACQLPDSDEWVEITTLTIPGFTADDFKLFLKHHTAPEEEVEDVDDEGDD